MRGKMLMQLQLRRHGSHVHAITVIISHFIINGTTRLPQSYDHKILGSLNKLDFSMLVL